MTHEVKSTTFMTILEYIEGGLPTYSILMVRSAMPWDLIRFDLDKFGGGLFFKRDRLRVLLSDCIRCF